MRSTRAPIIIPLLLVIVGVVLLMNNFLLLEGLAVTRFAPFLLVLAGAQLLVRGDLGISWQTQPFGITRGTVNSASLEASSGEIDIKIRSLRREGRLIAGQYTARSRPGLTVRNNHAYLTMQRGQTWPFSQGDWEIGLARDVPWSMLISTHLGEIDIDFRGLRVREANIASGFGDIKLMANEFIESGVCVRSIFGSITLQHAPEVAIMVRIDPRATARIDIDETQYLMVRPGLYASLGYDQAEAPSYLDVATTFGTIRLQ
jgi:hypothetical protein